VAIVRPDSEKPLDPDFPVLTCNASRLTVYTDTLLLGILGTHMDKIVDLRLFKDFEDRRSLSLMAINTVTKLDEARPPAAKGILECGVLCMMPFWPSPHPRRPTLCGSTAFQQDIVIAGRGFESGMLISGRFRWR
jgi:hypothetical protein